MVTAGSMALPQRWTETVSWCLGGARPCPPPSRCTLPPRAAFLTAATAEAAAQGAEREEEAKVAGEEYTRTSERNWTAKSGSVTFLVYFSQKSDRPICDEPYFYPFFVCESLPRPHREIKKKQVLLWVMSGAAARSAMPTRLTLWLAVLRARSGRRELWRWRTSWFIRKTRKLNLQQGASGNTTGCLWKVQRWCTDPYSHTDNDTIITVRVSSQTDTLFLYMNASTIQNKPLDRQQEHLQEQPHFLVQPICLLQGRIHQTHEEQRQFCGSCDVWS